MLSFNKILDISVKVAENCGRDSGVDFKQDLLNLNQRYLNSEFTSELEAIDAMYALLLFWEPYIEIPEYGNINEITLEDVIFEEGDLFNANTETSSLNFLCEEDAGILILPREIDNPDWISGWGDHLSGTGLVT